MTRTRFAIAALLCATLWGCLSKLNPVIMPLTVAPPPGEAIDTTGRRLIEGVYAVTSGNELFGDTLVVRFVRNGLCIFSGSQVMFCETAGSMNGDTARFAGYYRFVRSEKTGDLLIQVLPNEGGSGLRTGIAAPQVVIRGTYADLWSRFDLVLTRARPITASTDSFEIIGNCGGGRNSERLGRSENSIEMAMFSDVLGCTGIEIDLQVTKDGEVIVMHDGSFSPRTVLSTFVLGDIQNFTMDQIRRNARLIHGEQIPTIDEYLTAVVDSTDLRVVWLDPKVAVGIDRMVSAQRRAMERAKTNGVHTPRPFEVLLGLPSVEIMNAYRNRSNPDVTPILCELEPALVRTFPKGTVWGPRWTGGTQLDFVRQLQSEGYRVYPWTIDSPDYMKEFLTHGSYDGILSNYPCMLTGSYYQIGKK
jgi:glycerophosphoryl diester phosphodiesterase